MRRFVALLILLCLLLPGYGAAREETAPALELQRSVTRALVGKGESTTLIYRVENRGEAALENVAITDVLCGKIAEMERLEPGEYRVFQVRLAVTRECESRPAATWYSEGKLYGRELDAIAIHPVVTRLQIALMADRAEAGPGEIVSLTLYLANNGDTVLRDIAVKDAHLGDLGMLEGEIAPGETRRWTYECRATQSARYCMTATATASTGGTATAQSNAISVAVVEDEAPASLSISAAPCEQEAAAGRAWVEIVLENEGDRPIGGVTISEKSQGVLRTLVSVAPGRTVLRLECAAQEQERAQFLAQFTAPDGTSKTVLSEEIALRPGTAQPRVLLSGAPVQLGVSAYVLFMNAGLGVLVLLAGALVVIWTKKALRRRRVRARRARNMRAMRKSARMQEDEFAQTRPHKAVSLEMDDQPRE